MSKYMNITYWNVDPAKTASMIVLNICRVEENKVAKKPTLTQAKTNIELKYHGQARWLGGF